MNTRILSSFVSAILVLTWASLATANAGVAEINQTCAVQTGCFRGDDPGFPVTIYDSGSYRLTGNLETENRSLTAIEIQENDVAIDLGGFAIACSLRDRFLPPQCGEAVNGIGRGIRGVGEGSLERRFGTEL